MSDNPPKYIVDPDEATRLLSDVFAAHGMPPTNAAIVSQAMVAADLRGVDTHGMHRLPSYLTRARLTTDDGSETPALSLTASPELTSPTPVVHQVNGNNTLGHLPAHLAMEKCIESAQTYGISMASISHSNHFGMSAWICQQAIDANMMSLVFTNSSPALPPFGGREKLLGVSPIACGAPGGGSEGGEGWILDMAPSVAARGKIYKAKRRGEKIPKDWALDGEGKETDDPAKALEGVMLPMGGPKGSALAIMMDVFSGVLSGSSFAGQTIGPYSTTPSPSNVGHFIVAIKPDLFMSLSDFKSRMQILYERVTGVEKAAGVERIYFPGEMERMVERQRREDGIPIVEAELNALNEEARRVGVAEMKVKVVGESVGASSA